MVVRDMRWLYDTITMDVDISAVHEISELTVKEIRARINGTPVMVPHSERATTRKESLVHYILANANEDCIELVRRAGREKRVVRNDTMVDAVAGK